MAELNKEEVAKELRGMVDKAKEASMSPADKEKAVADKKKADETKVVTDAAEKRTAEILSASDEDLKDPKKFSDEERALRPELQKKAEVAKEATLSTDDKVKRVKEESQKAVDRIKNELLQMQDKTSKEAEALRKKIEELEKKSAEPKKEDLASVIAKEEQERIVKYSEEDKDKPREQRREMSDEDWEQWELEEPAKAKRWLTQNEARRSSERRKSAQEKGLQKLFDKHHESALKTYVKHPELDTTKREKELLAEGKSKEEISDILFKENEKFRVAGEILKEHPDWFAYEDCPERIIAEMEKRLASPSSNKTIDDLTAKVEELSAELAKLNSGDEGVNSTIQANRKKAAISDAEKAVVKTMTEMKASQPMIDEAVRKLRAGKGTSAAV